VEKSPTPNFVTAMMAFFLLMWLVPQRPSPRAMMRNTFTNNLDLRFAEGQWRAGWGKASWAGPRENRASDAKRMGGLQQQPVVVQTENDAALQCGRQVWNAKV